MVEDPHLEDIGARRLLDLAKLPWRLRRDRCTLYDADGDIARFHATEDASFVLAVFKRLRSRRRLGDDRPRPVSPGHWGRDELATGCEAERQLTDGHNRPIITLYAEHPRSAYNEDFILLARNRDVMMRR
jgi:hypothetical protein